MHASPALSGQQLHVLIFSYVFFSGVIIIAWLLFVVSLVRTLRHVPKEQRVMPIWLLWFTTLFALSYALSWLVGTEWVTLLCAFVGLIFTWMLLPFALPTSLLRMTSADSATAKSIRVLGHVGLANQIAITVMYGVKLFLFFSAAPSAEGLLMISTGGVMSTVLPVIFALVGATAIITWVFYWARIVSIRVELG